MRKCDVCNFSYTDVAMLHAEPERGIPWETCRNCMYAGRVPYHILVSKVAARGGDVSPADAALAHWYGKSPKEFSNEVLNYIQRNSEVEAE